MSYGGSGGAGSIAQSSDAALSNPVTGNVLTYDSSVQKWKNQPPAAAGTVIDALLAYGAAAVGSNVLPPGYRTARTTTLTSAYLYCGTAPSGSSLTITVTRAGTTLLTLSLAAGQTATTQTGLSIALTVGDILQFNITAIGSTGPGSDVALQLIGS